MLGPFPVSVFLDAMIEGLATAIMACFDALIGLITGALLITPNVTGLPQVQALTGRSVLIVDSLYLLVFVAAGVLTMVAGNDERSRYGIKDLAPRLVVGFVAAHFSQLACSHLIDAANAMTAAVTSDDPTGSGTPAPAAVAGIRAQLLAAQDHTAGLLFVVCAAIIVALLGATTFQMIVRFAVAVCLTAAAPLALACHALPQTDPVARAWWRGYLGTLAVPVAQGFTLYAGQWMLTDPARMLPLLGLPVEPGAVINLFIVMVLLWITVKIPGLMRRWALAGNRSPNILGAVVRVVVVQQLGRTLPRMSRLMRTARP